MVQNGAVSGGRLPEALFVVFLLDSKGAKVQELVNLVNLVESFRTRIFLQKLAKMMPRTGFSEFTNNRPEGKVEQT